MRLLSNGAFLFMTAMIETRPVWSKATIESVLSRQNLRRKRKYTSTKSRVADPTEDQFDDTFSNDYQRQLVDLWSLGIEYSDIIGDESEIKNKRNGASSKEVKNSKNADSAFILEEMEEEMKFRQLTSYSYSMPTPSPTPLPTNLQTLAPTNSPTASPTESPTASPTVSPTISLTDPPTPITNCVEGTTREAFLLAIFSEITDVTLLQDDSTPQGKAYDWFVIDDTDIDVCTYPTLLQRYALVVLYYSTNGKDWINKTDWLSAKNECEWFGITCPEGSTLVQSIQLGANNLSGPLPEEIEVFEELVSLELFGNSLSSSIPKGIGKLSNLKFIDFEENTLTGDIFIPEILSLDKLQSLRLSFNEFTDEIPPGISALTDLQELWIAQNLVILEDETIQNNGITGIIPTEIGTLKNLTSILLYSNSIEGALPSELGLVKDLVYLRLENNFFEQNIPQELYELTLLQQLRLDENFLSGTISENIGNLDALQDLRLTFNFLEGTIPQTISKLVDLENLLVNGNNFNGNFPNVFSDFQFLDFFDISDNRHEGPGFEGPIPDTIFDIPTIRLVYMSNNSFTGSIPANYVAPPGLRDLYLNGNNLDGEVPPIGDTDFSELSEFLLQENDLTGSVPASLCALVNSTKGILEDLWSDCAGENPQIQCDFPECCTKCFE